MLQIAGIQLRAPSNLTRFVLCALISVALMLLDARGHHLQQIRAGLTVLLSPIQMIAAVPVRVGSAVVNLFQSDASQREELERLRKEQPLLFARIEQYEALAAENAHLRQLLGTSAQIADKAVAAELVEVASEPFRRTIVIAKGTRDDLYVGQPVIDAYGIQGQVTEVGLHRSRAILITDPDHAIPVQVNRNGLRAVAFGTGDAGTVSIRYLTASADIKEGDLLVSSGLGGGFPFGYPVAKVSKIINNPNESFLDIVAIPVAQLGHNKEVLLIWPSKVAAPPAAKKPEPASVKRKSAAAGKPVTTPAPVKTKPVAAPATTGTKPAAGSPNPDEAAAAPAPAPRPAATTETAPVDAPTPDAGVNP